MATKVNANKTAAKANLSITFASDCEPGNEIVIELDADLNDDKSCFLFGQTAYFRVYSKPLNLEFDTFCSDSTASIFFKENVTAQNDETEQTQQIEFIEEQTGTLDKPASSLLSQKWFGNDLGTIALVSPKSILAPNKVSDMYFGVAELKYIAPYRVYGLIVYTKTELQLSEDKNFPVIVYLKEKTETT
jgi:hypothetical protein